MRRLLFGTLFTLGLAGLSTQAFALPGVPSGKAKVPKTPDVADVDVPELPEMSVDEMIKAIDDASRKLDLSAVGLFDAQMKLLEALGKADLALEYREKAAKLQAAGASEERDAAMVELATDQAIIDAMVDAFDEKGNKMDAERKKAARQANLEIVVSRLMAAATSEDAGTVSAATIDMNKRVAQKDETLLDEIKPHAKEPVAFVAGMSARAGNIKRSASAMLNQSREVSKVMDKYRKKKKLFDPITDGEAKELFAQSGF